MAYDEWKFPPLAEAKSFSAIELREEIKIAESHISVLQNILDEKEAD